MPDFITCLVLLLDASINCHQYAYVLGFFIVTAKYSTNSNNLFIFYRALCLEHFKHDSSTYVEIGLDSKIILRCSSVFSIQNKVYMFFFKDRNCQLTADILQRSLSPSSVLRIHQIPSCCNKRHFGVFLALMMRS